MTTSTLIFVLIGVGFVSGNIMKMLMWLDDTTARRKEKYVR